MCINIIKARIGNLGQLAPLFNSYRIFYKQESNLKAAEAFLKERLEQDDSAIFLALEEDNPVGFTQLYPTFSSVGMKKFYTLNDLYVDPKARKKGVATKLMQIAEEYTSLKGFDKIVLKTGLTNETAKALYNNLGYNPDQNFLHFEKVNLREPSVELSGVVGAEESHDFI